MALFLAATTDKLQVISSAAATLDVHVSYVDMSTSTFLVTGLGKQNTAITTAATTDVLAAPAASTVRTAKMINIRNKHASLACDVTVQFNQNGTLIEMHKVNLAAGELLTYTEGLGWFEYNAQIVDPLFKILSADDAGGQNVLTAQPWFPTTGALTVTGDTTYIMDGILAITRTAGTTSHTTSLLFGGTASLTSIQYVATSDVGDTDALLPRSAALARVATATVVKAASVVATEAIQVLLKGIIRINAAGTLIPQFIYSAAPGGTPTIKANTYFRLIRVGGGSVVTQGTWS